MAENQHRVALTAISGGRIAGTHGTSNGFTIKFHHKTRNYTLIGEGSKQGKPLIHAFKSGVKPMTARFEDIHPGFNGAFQTQVKRIAEAGKGTFYTIGAGEDVFKWTVKEEK